jgi:hypothetical protein
VKHDDASGITVLLFNPNRDACGFRTFAELCQIRKPFTRAPGEWKIRRSSVKDKQLCIPDNSQTERAIKGSLAGLLEIDCAEDAPKSTHCYLASEPSPDDSSPTRLGEGM